MSTRTGFDLDGLTRAIQRHDSEYRLALYADDAQVEIVDSAQPEARTHVLQGKPAIRAWIENVSSAAVHYELRHAVARPDRLAYTEECRYADGSKVLLECTTEVRRGQISHAAVTVVHVPSDQSLPQPAQPTSTRTTDHLTRPRSSRRASSPPWAERHLPGYFVG